PTAPSYASSIGHQGERAVIEFRKFSGFPGGTVYDILQDAYSFDAGNKQIRDRNRKKSGGSAAARNHFRD
ncbi:MAG: hypothetical protein ABTA22_06850, partial [Clostridia bacterium]